MKKIKSFFKVDTAKVRNIWYLLAMLGLYAVSYVLYNGTDTESVKLLSALTFLVATEYANKLI